MADLAGGTILSGEPRRPTRSRSSIVTLAALVLITLVAVSVSLTELIGVREGKAV